MASQLIPFNKHPCTGAEEEYVLQAMRSGKLSGDGPFGKKCQEWFEEKLNCKKALLTPSCTAALEMAAILLDIQPDDEIIMPSYTFVSTANAFAMRGARIVFVDIRPDTMNIDETLIESAITAKTKAIVPVHYAGVSCEMDIIMDVANRFNLFVIEDAAQGVMSTYKGRPLGSIGHLGAFSFHETKNYSSGGEGGLLIINDEAFSERAEIIREKGTNRRQFLDGRVDKYSWVDIGSSYLPSELQAAFLWGQLVSVEKILSDRMSSWNFYNDSISALQGDETIELQIIPPYCVHNAHMFYLKFKNKRVTKAFIDFLKRHDILAVPHYVPLHSSLAGEKFSRFHKSDIYTTKESERLVRLPLYYGLNSEEKTKVVDIISIFYQNKGI